MILAGLLGAAVAGWFLLRYRIVPAVFRSPKLASNVTSGIHAWSVALMSHARSDLAVYLSLSYMLYDTVRIAMTSAGERIMTLHHAIVVMAVVITARYSDQRHDLWQWLATLEASNLGLYFAYHWAQTNGRVPLWLLAAETAVYVYGRAWRGSHLMYQAYARYGPRHPIVVLGATMWGMSMVWSGVLLRQVLSGVRGQFCMA